MESQKVSERPMRRRTSSNNINVTSKSREVARSAASSSQLSNELPVTIVGDSVRISFDTDSEAQNFYKECQDKSTASEIEKNKVTLLMPAKITCIGKMLFKY